MHLPYEQRLGHKADFRVKYKFIDHKNGGRKQLPFQGIRSDFSYDEGNSVYIIWPEFEDENGNVVLENDKPVAVEGTALMWIVIPERRGIHKEMIKVGTKCFFREGIITASCEVIEVLNLFSNPTQ
ncbi:hypothetical protein GSY63_09935 [Mucilaginibacter sp. R11]|uniref:Uncharacterized protein n=2 Tax=Mucilaginibacter agri TaxID=2695265 RepID=A0A965ZGP9_9SPHI|nr:hypothetical protein [Mucilaginibacter agri]